MSFISREFAIFFAVVATVYFVLPYRVRWVWLLSASLYFYGSTEPTFLFQILAATLFAFMIGLLIERASNKPKKKLILIIGVCFLLANLIIFKYTEFLNETLRATFVWANLAYPISNLSVLLPIGLSFYTFLLVGYLIDVFRGTRAEHHPGIFSLYVLFFPKLVAGPIERSKNLLPQLHEPQPFNYGMVVLGFQLILWGVFKKVVVADRADVFVDSVYSAPQAADGVMMIAATILYSFQLYCDFSGYTDIALGTAGILGFRLLPNFNKPYFATSISDFWKRWHISLTSWLTDYVYTPLTRQRIFKIKFFTMMLIGLFLTFVVSGIWHGAGWTFVIWGMLHGAYIVSSLLMQKRRAKFVRFIKLDELPKLHHIIRVVCTFALVCYAYIWFRANTTSDAIYITTHLFTGWSTPLKSLREFIALDTSSFLVCAMGVIAVIAADIIQGRGGLREVLALHRAWTRWGLYYVGVMSVFLFGMLYDKQTFLYFRF